MDLSLRWYAVIMELHPAFVHPLAGVSFRGQMSREKMGFRAYDIHLVFVYSHVFILYTFNIGLCGSSRRATHLYSSHSHDPIIGSKSLANALNMPLYQKKSPSKLTKQ